MSGAGAPQIAVDGEGLTVEIVASLWHTEVMDGLVERQNGSVILMNDNGEEVSRYNFENAWPCKWKGWDLDGKGSDTAIEEIELAGHLTATGADPREVESWAYSARMA